MVVRERDIQGKVVGYARGKLAIARKLDFGDGWPDYMFLYKGRILFIEFKRPGEKLRPLQDYVRGMLRNAGFVVYVIDSVERGHEVVDRFIAGPGNSVVDYSSITKELSE